MDPERFRNSTAGKPIRTAQGYWTFLPHPLPPSLSWSAELVSQLSAAERNLAILREKGSDFDNPQTMIQPFVRREAVLSSRIEGTQTPLNELYRFEAGAKSVPADAPEVGNYVRALAYGLDRLERLPISLRLLREIHGVLFADLGREAVTPGEFRRRQNWVGPPGSTVETAPYVPPPVEEMHAALGQLERYLHTDSDLPALVRIGLIHYQFEAIHPFLDGNGRLGRMLISLLLRIWELLPHPWLYLSGYFEARRQAYYDGLLRVSESGDWESWLGMFLEAVERQSAEAAGTLDRLERLRERYRQMVEGERAAVGLTRVVDFLLGHPVVNVRQVERGIGASDFSTANRYVGRLTELGLLREVTGQSRNRIFRADEVLAAIYGDLEV